MRLSTLFGLIAALASTASAAETPRPAILASLASTTTLIDIAPAGEAYIAVGQRGHVLRSTDGQAWTQIVSPHNAMLNRVRFRDADHGWAMGHEATIIATTDGGRSWSLQHWDPDGRAINDLLFMDGGKLIAIGAYGTYLESTDGGANWTEAGEVFMDMGYHLNAGLRLANGTAVVVGERSLMARSSDNGETWDVLDSPYEGSLFGLLPYGEGGAMVYGMRGNVYVAADINSAQTMDADDFDPFDKQTVDDPEQLAAMGWRHLVSPTTESLFGGQWRDGSALLVGVNGTAVRADPDAGTLSLVETAADETLGDALWIGDGWVAVGRRGIQHMGALTWK